MRSYVPRKGDFVAVSFAPQSGHEQRGRRPALVVSNTLFNQRTGLAIVCPLTNTDRAFPFHVAVVNDPDVAGFVMVEQVKSIDFRARKAKRIGRVSAGVLEEVLSLLDACIY
jgi:mRNA interferase MazF